ncbi:MAG: hypothetical protein GF418_02885 [Chitinivibrionales bacterium]|nr:hypothetical protein [Chitinivibrionales bacterium]MBD3394548.1 hypothetical protein [Chitinivibrionales bacterium]
MNIFAELARSFLPGQDGFLFMWVLLIVAVLAVVLAIERWMDIKRRTDVDAPGFTDRLRLLIRDGKFDEAFNLCASGGRRALPRILGSGIKRAGDGAEVILASMEEETLHMIPILEKRINLMLMLGNVATLLGLMGTIFGLILSFDAVARPDVEAIEKSSLLAAGISTAMNTTLFGLMISVPCVLAYSVFRSRIDQAVSEIDRYAVSLLKVLLPADSVRKDYKVSGKRIKQEVDTEVNIAPMMNLMVILIPLLLSSAEFVKIGAIEMKLPESGGAGGGGGGDAADTKKDARLDAGVVITAKGFNIFHYFKEESEGSAGDGAAPAEADVEIPLVKGEYDFEKLNAELAKVKRLALREIIHSTRPSVPKNATLMQLYTEYTKNDYSSVGMFRDHESVKLVAEDKIKYQTVVSVMDAARGTATPHGDVTMFPNVSLAGGIVQ